MPSLAEIPPEDRRRTAMHEACHGVVALVLGLKVDLLSIRPGEGYSGVTLYGGIDLPRRDLTVYYAAPSQPPPTREAIEKDIIASLAGPASEYMLPPLSGRFPPDHDEERIAAALRSLQRLEPALACRLTAAEATPANPGEPDNVKVQRAAWLLNGFEQTLASAHLYYLRAIADELVGRHRHAINAVAAALLKKTVLTGAAVAKIVARNRCICHEWEEN